MPYGDEQFYYYSTLSQERPTSGATPRTSQQREGREAHARTDPTSQNAKMARRKERCRINQSRYRQRKREYLLNLKKANADLRKNIDDLMQVQQGGPPRDSDSENPWCIVANVFSFVQNSFQNPAILSDSVPLIKTLLVELKFSPDVAMGSVSGVGGLMQQLRRYATYFMYPAIHLKRVEAATLGVLTATAMFTITISAGTIHMVFPHLDKDRGNTDAQVSLGRRLLGQWITCHCSMSFVFDEVNSRVIYLEVNVDWITALLRLLGSMEDVANVLDGALITHEGVLGTSSET